MFPPAERKRFVSDQVSNTQTSICSEVNVARFRSWRKMSMWNKKVVQSAQSIATTVKRLETGSAVGRRVLMGWKVVVLVKPTEVWFVSCGGATILSKWYCDLDCYVKMAGKRKIYPADLFVSRRDRTKQTQRVAGCVSPIYSFNDSCQYIIEGFGCLG